MKESPPGITNHLFGFSFSAYDNSGRHELNSKTGLALRLLYFKEIQIIETGHGRIHFNGDAIYVCA